MDVETHRTPGKTVMCHVDRLTSSSKVIKRILIESGLSQSVEDIDPEIFYLIVHRRYDRNSFFVINIK